MVPVLASIPSPSTGVWEAGPLTIRFYGLCLLAGIVAAVVVGARRWGRWGGDPDLIVRAAMWGVAGGIVGARLYHVITSWSEVPDPKWQGAFEIWKGGLGIWGGIAGGVLVGAWIVRRSGASVLAALDAVAPGILLAQAIGRWGNYFNQELFGTPSSLPWALEIDPAHRPARYAADPTFHPTFLYESLWNLIGVLLILFVVERLWHVRPPGIFCLYVAWYTFGRTFEELDRTDPAHVILGLRLNVYVSIGVFAAAVAAFVWSQRRRGDDVLPARPRAAPPAGPRMAIPKSRVRGRR